MNECMHMSTSLLEIQYNSSLKFSKYRSGLVDTNVLIRERILKLKTIELGKSRRRSNGFRNDLTVTAVNGMVSSTSALISSQGSVVFS